MTDRLTALDATFLELEQLDEGALMSIGGLMVFDPLPGGGVPTVEDVRANLAARLGALPRYTQRLSSRRSGSLAWPHWVRDERFDVGEHVGHAGLPSPGGEAELCDWLAEYFSHPLDRTRPLWHMVLIEGLEGGRWAIGNKTHHCLVDGVGSVDVADLLLDREPSPPPAPDGDGGRITPETDRAPARFRLPDAPEPLVQAAQAGTQAAGAAVHAALHPRDAFERSRALAELIVKTRFGGAPRTSLGCPIGQTRRFAVVRAELEECKAIGRRLGGSFNDVTLAACAGGLRRLLMARGEEVPERGMRAMVPMNLRDVSGKLALGNRVTSVFVELPVAEPDPVARLQTIAARTARLKRAGAGAGAATLMDIAALAPPVVMHAALARTAFSRRMFNLTITNVPGPRHPLYAFGAPLREVYPVVPLAAEHAVGIAIFTYDGTVTFGLNADAPSTPDLAVLASGIEEGLQELRAAVPGLDTTPGETRT
jgi:WS/DGAT/MGAT family acyltransferase